MRSPPSPRVRLGTRLLLLTTLVLAPSLAPLLADEGGDDALRDRYRVTVLHTVVRGDWSAWVERREDLMTRAIRRSTRIVRKRNGAEPEDLVIERGN